MKNSLQFMLLIVCCGSCQKNPPSVVLPFKLVQITKLGDGKDQISLPDFPKTSFLQPSVVHPQNLTTASGMVVSVGAIERNISEKGWNALFPGLLNGFSDEKKASNGYGVSTRIESQEVLKKIEKSKFSGFVAPGTVVIRKKATVVLNLELRGKIDGASVSEWTDRIVTMLEKQGI